MHQFDVWIAKCNDGIVFDPEKTEGDMEKGRGFRLGVLGVAIIEM